MRFIEKWWKILRKLQLDGKVGLHRLQVDPGGFVIAHGAHIMTVGNRELFD